MLVMTERNLHTQVGQKLQMLSLVLCHTAKHLSLDTRQGAPFTQSLCICASVYSHSAQYKAHLICSETW